MKSSAQTLRDELEKTSQDQKNKIQESISLATNENKVLKQTIESLRSELENLISASLSFRCYLRPAFLIPSNRVSLICWLSSGITFS